MGFRNPQSRSASTRTANMVHAWAADLRIAVECLENAEHSYRGFGTGSGSASLEAANRMIEIVRESMHDKMKEPRK